MPSTVSATAASSSSSRILDFPVPLTQEIENNVSAALSEDVGAGDLTASLVPAGSRGRARVIARESAVLCGQAWFEACFRHCDPAVAIHWQVAEGAPVEADQVLCEIEGDARALLTAERSALNFLQLLSGVATKTRRYVEAVAGTGAQIVDTRKTLPGLRLAQKYAVRAGGGGNHRLALWDAILIKENHILAAGGITPAVRSALAVAAEHQERCRFVQVEVENLAELQEALAAGTTMILLDNFDLASMAEAARLTTDFASNRPGPRPCLEASGGVTLEGVRAIAETGVDRISIGGLTKDVKALDLSMRFTAA